MWKHTHRIAAFTLGVAIGGSAMGQIGGVGGHQSIDVLPWGQVDCERFYVNPDPLIGSDNNAGTIDQPFLTIGWGIYKASHERPAVVVLMPGIYSGNTNGEWFPVQMVADVSLQGFAATNTVLQSDGSTVIEFLATGPDYEDTYVDSLTVTGGSVGVHMISELTELGPTVSNCVVADNTFGIKMETIWDHDTGEYVRIFPKLINNTIAHNEYGIFDVGYLGPDAGKGVADPAIVNCAVVFNPVADLAGPDATDVSHTAFQTVDWSMLASGNSPPLTWSWTGSMTAANTFIDSANFDYRQCCGSLLVDEGTLDLSVPNGTAATPVSPCGMDILDYDEEGYGNPRIERMIDVGADEQGQLIVSGYMPMTTRFSATASGGAYATVTVHHLPDPDTGYAAVARTLFTQSYVGDLALIPRSVPGLRASGTSRPQDLGARGVLWLDRTAYAGMHVSNVDAYCDTTDFWPVLSAKEQFNYQELMTGPDGLSPFSNVQSFQYGP